MKTIVAIGVALAVAYFLAAVGVPKLIIFLIVLAVTASIAAPLKGKD
jgi:hypothetical protein